MKYSGNKGFTLVELLVAMAIASIVMAVVVTTYQLQVRGKNTQEALNDMNQTTRAALEVMTNEIRSAGFDTVAPTAPVAGILIANANQLQFTMDISNGVTLQPNGVVTDPNENVTYQLYVDGNGNQNLGRNTGGGLMPLARNVDALDFVYLNGNTPPAVIPTPVSAANLANIRSIQVTIVARAGEAGGVGYVGRHTDNTAYFNQQGTQILAAQNDNYRRVLLTTTIQCRNIGI
jgi:type IV pilus assembly protein PilW